MRTLLAAIVVAALIVTGVAIVVPLIAKPMIVAAIQRQSPFPNQQLAIEVDCNVFGLLQGSIDQVHVHGTDLHRGDTTIGAVDLTLTGVSTSRRRFRGVTGTIAAIRIPLDDATSLTIDGVTLGGASGNATAVVTLDRAASLALIRSAFADGGVEISGLELGNGMVSFEVFGAQAAAPLGVDQGAILVLDPFGQGDFEMVTPGPNDGWTVTGVSVTPAGMTIEANLDVEKLLASS